jgi:hypothetical protein
MPITLKNNTGSLTKVGYVAAIDPRDPNAFVYVSANATKAIGVILEAVEYRKYCKIATIGERVMVYTTSMVNAGDSLRSAVSNDRISIGQSTIVKSSDSSYLKIGNALTSGRGLVPIILELTYISSSAGGITPVADGTYTIGFGIATDGVVTVQSGLIVTIIEAT